MAVAATTTAEDGALDRTKASVTGTHIMLVSNPNTGKTTLFNELTGLRHKTSNFPGTTLDVRVGTFVLDDGGHHHLYDMPGLYTLASSVAEERVASRILHGDIETGRKPDAIILVLDATNLTRNLYLASQVMELGVPVVVALNMIDLAEKADIRIDRSALETHLGCPVVETVARKGKGLDELRRACREALEAGVAPKSPKLLRQTENPDQTVRYTWAEQVTESCVTGKVRPVRGKTEKVDGWLTKPLTGVPFLLAVMFGVFYLIFSLASLPMDLIDGTVGNLGALVGGMLPEGLLQSLVVDGIIAGVGGVLVFLPQICFLFFCISVLEDSGYLARAACLLDRVLRHVGLPGKAFVPMLSAHACAIPAIMSSRIIEDRNDRLVTILVLPLMTCSARLPVYAMVTALLFPQDPLKGALVFTAAYATGILVAMAMAFLFRQTLVRKPTTPLMIELPNYKTPSIKTALMAAFDRGILFVRKAGTVILALSIILWWLMTFPQVPEERVDGLDEGAAQQSALDYSFAGRMGHAIEPVLEPLGFDWKIGVGIVASFAAREVVVSALSIIYGAGEDEEGSVLLDRLQSATRADGTPVFGFATSVSFLVFYILAMQCLPTQAVTARETGSWKWAVFQLAYMTVLAYGASLLTYQSLTFLGVG